MSWSGSGDVKKTNTPNQFRFIQIFILQVLSDSLDDANLQKKMDINYTMFISRVNKSVPALSGISGSFECITNIQFNLKFTSLARVWQLPKAI